MLAVVPEWVLQSLVGHLKGAVARAVSELDRLDIRLCLDVRRAPVASSSAGGESLESLERRMLDLLAEVNRLRRA
ncbi:MAG TPA: hypothetical protein VJT49_06875 [Amycolatopsis sp.]|uniref:hypothetical protein n=1 Tax=Amycolatopsis sp. TaxID=37632 RepID=UPI002B49BF1F|nr:hypothetical protein [Amycolatopsis sp.]HKS44831.1 hypothetical protein [Amycolatopsis sp.]